MGYYTGSGVTSSGGESVSIAETFVFYGAHNVYQNTVSTVTRKSGVSLGTAQNEHSTINMNVNQFTWGSASHWTPNAYGTRKDVSYSQIGDSNLYDLIVTNSTIKCKMDNGEWVG